MNCLESTLSQKIITKLFIYAVSALLSLMVSVPCLAGYYEGVNAFNRGDYATAYREFHPLANNGNAKAQLNLGLMYDLGKGVRQDKRKAAAWYRKAAEQGYPPAQYNLALQYDRGEGVHTDKAQAAAWFRKAAEHGHAKAQFNLGIMYEHGEGLQQDKKQAAAWYRKAAEQGYAKAQHNLGVMYLHGDGIKQDKPQAAAWFRKAAEQGFAWAQHNLGLMYKYGVGVQKNKAKAAAWLRKAAAQGDTNSANSLRRLHDVDKRTMGLDAIALGVAVWVLMQASNDEPARNNHASENSECYKKIGEQIATCRVFSSGCDMVGCNYDADCNKGWEASRCETALSRRANAGGIGWGTYYCDTKNATNHSTDWNSVASKICSDM